MLKSGIQILIPGYGFVCLLQTSQNNFLLPGYGFVNDFNAYQAPSDTPFFIGFPS
jgi:hypothetical protein